MPSSPSRATTPTSSPRRRRPQQGPPSFSNSARRRAKLPLLLLCGIIAITIVGLLASRKNMAVMEAIDKQQWFHEQLSAIPTTNNNNNANNNNSKQGLLEERNVAMGNGQQQNDNSSSNNNNNNNSGTREAQAQEESQPEPRDAESAKPDSLSPPLFDLNNPVWPDQPPTPRDDCQVVFRNPDMRLCHIVPWGANFGDEIGPPIAKRILELYFGCSAVHTPTLDFNSLGEGRFDFHKRDVPCFLTVGSLWRMAHSGDHLWGTGVAYDHVVNHRCNKDKEFPVTNLTIYSTRGPLSQDHVRKYCKFFFPNNASVVPDAGDAGALIPYLFPELIPRHVISEAVNTHGTHSHCFIPHHHERNNPIFAKAQAQGAIRMTVQQSWENMTHNMLQCQSVVSSSLHGVILAEAFGIPSRRLRLTYKPGDFKFNDYYVSYRGQQPEPFATTMEAAHAGLVTPLKPEEREAYARKVIQSFPIHLFTTKPKTSKTTLTKEEDDGEPDVPKLEDEEQDPDDTAVEKKKPQNIMEPPEELQQQPVAQIEPVAEEHPQSPADEAKLLFDLQNPTWPEQPPTPRKDCQVVFRNSDMRLCHIVPWGANFGDEIGPPIAKRILELYFGCSAAETPTLDFNSLGPERFDFHKRDVPCFLTVGSLWRMTHTGDHLWGTGVAYDHVVNNRCNDDKKFPVKNLTIYSTRGPLSQEHVRKYCKFFENQPAVPTAGDAGALIPYLFPELIPSRILQEETYDEGSQQCFIPHHHERNSKTFQQAERAGAVRLTVQQSWENMTESMLKCKSVVSSSLHGVIFAEALGIPSRRLRLTYKPGDFKFNDYYVSYRGEQPPTVDTMPAAWDSLVTPLSPSDRDAYARRVLSSFPIHLFTTAPKTEAAAANVDDSDAEANADSLLDSANQEQRAEPQQDPVERAVELLEDIAEKAPIQQAVGLIQRIAEEAQGGGSSMTSGLFDLKNPMWPEQPPSPRQDCRVVFRDPHMRLCHLVPWGANFGDEIGPPIAKRILELFFGCSAANVPTFDLNTLGNELLHSRNMTCFLTVGSLWRMANSGDHMWGTGVAYDTVVNKRCNKDPKHKVQNLTIYSTRGPLSQGHVRKFCRFFSKAPAVPDAGDAGALVPYLFPELIPRRNIQDEVSTDGTKECFIPHHHERNTKTFKKAERRGAVRLTVQQSWENMTESMLKCKSVVSSSLHGIIFAEAFGIPSRRLRLTYKPGDFKFDDYYVSYRGTQPEAVNTMEKALEGLLQPLSASDRDAYARRVLASFPIHLFASEPIASLSDVSLVGRDQSMMA